MKSRSSHKHPLRSGIPCVNHRCVRCCIETSMPLSVFDIQKIVKRGGYDLSNFTIEADGGRQLKNIAGRCAFLSEDGCTIYPYRPEGCQLYPLIWDEDRGQAVRDYLCPYASEFDVKKADITKLKNLLGRLGV
jgi:Fe-S-cluster containining protein